VITIITKGQRLSEEHKQAISNGIRNSQKYRDSRITVSKTLKEKYANGWTAMKGHTHTEDFKKKRSKKYSGKGNPRYGCHLSEEQKEKYKKSMKDYKHSEETKKKISISCTGEKNGFFGKTHSNEFKDKQRIKMINRIINNEIPNQNTFIELKIKQQFIDANIDFIHQYNADDKFVCDFYLPEQNLIIEADGDYWHGRPETMKKDVYRNIYLNNAGYDVLHVWESIINEENFNIMEMI